MLVVSVARGGKLVSLKVFRAEIEADIPYIFFYRLGLLIREMCLEIRTKKTKCRHTVLKTEFHFNISRSI